MSAWRPFITPAALVLSTSAPCFATTYLTVEQAQSALFPGKGLTAVEVKVSAEQRKAIERASDTRWRTNPKVWRASDGGWLVVDEVLGKHEFITYAVSLSAGGAVKQVEIMEYRESYGHQVREAQWRAQFVGKTARAPLKLDEDIRNISGATLSSRHVTEGVRRVLAFHEAVLK